MKTLNEKIIDYYNTTLSIYENAWHNSKTLALHFGYYDEKNKTHAASLVKINEVLANKAQISENDYILDAGCGVGGSAIWLAKNIKCKVVGININSSQLQKAVINASDNAVSHLVNFEKQNFTCTSFQEKTFSVVWAQESFSHTDKKQEFIHEAYRILNDKGRVIFADYILRDSPELTAKEQRVYNEWMDSWAVHGLISNSEYKKLLSEAGFKKIEFYDITKNMTPSLKKLYRMSCISGRIASLLLKLGLDKKLKTKNLWQLKNAIGAYNQYLALKTGVWKYNIIVAYKN